MTAQARHAGRAQGEFQSRAANWDEEVELLARALPPELARALHERTDPGELLEIVLDLGREPEARVPGREVLLADHPVSASDLEHVANNVGQFGDDNRAGIERTLHRVSAIRNRSGRIVGLTMRVGRAVTGTGEIIRDIVVSGQSILLLGRPGIGKTEYGRELGVGRECCANARDCWPMSCASESSSSIRQTRLAATVTFRTLASAVRGACR